MYFVDQRQTFLNSFRLLKKAWGAKVPLVEFTLLETEDKTVGTLLKEEVSKLGNILFIGSRYKRPIRLL